MPPEKVRLFVSWSGPVSRQIAQILRENIPSLLNAVEPWTSDEIEKGEEWHAQLSNGIKTSRAAIVCITPTNLVQPWLHFEAGALWSLGNAVAPYLFNLPKNSLAGTPLSHLQATDAFDEADSRRLYSMLNAVGGSLLSDLQFDRSFRKWWPAVNDELRAVSGSATTVDIQRAQELAPVSTSERPTPVGTQRMRSFPGEGARKTKNKIRRAQAVDIPGADRVTRSAYEIVFLKLVSGSKLRLDDGVYVPVGMKGWYHAVFRRETDGQEKTLTIDQLLPLMDHWH